MANYRPIPQGKVLLENFLFFLVKMRCLQFFVSSNVKKFIVQDQVSDAVNRMDQNRIRSTEVDPDAEDYNRQSWNQVIDAEPA